MSQYIDLNIRARKGSDVIDFAIHQGGRSIPGSLEEFSDNLFGVIEELGWTTEYVDKYLDSYSEEEDDYSEGERPSDFYEGEEIETNWGGYPFIVRANNKDSFHNINNNMKELSE